MFWYVRKSAEMNFKQPIIHWREMTKRKKNRKVNEKVAKNIYDDEIVEIYRTFFFGDF